MYYHVVIVAGRTRREFLMRIVSWRTVRKTVIAIAAFLLAASGCGAQCKRGIIGFDMIGTREGSPFSAVQLQTETETDTNGDGQTHVRTRPTFVARGESGRVRIERITSGLSDDPAEEEIRNAQRVIMICDPNAGKFIHIMSMVHIAEVSEDPTPAPERRVNYVWGSGRFPNARTKPLPPERQFEDLGEKDFDGVLAHGGLWTTLSEPNDAGVRTPVKTAEVWISEELEVTVLEIREDLVKRSEGRTRLTKLLRTEPDPSLFEIPEGYAIKKVPPRQMMKVPPKPKETAAESGQP